MSFDFGSIEESYRVLLQLRIIKAELELAGVIEFGDSLELLVQVFDEFDGVFGSGIGKLVKFVTMTMVVRFVIFGFEVEDVYVLEGGVGVLNDNERG